MTDVPGIDSLGDLGGARVLVRVDLNVPMKNGRVSDDTRIRVILPTVRALMARGATIILISHFGRPKGVRDESMSLRQVLSSLEEVIGEPVSFVDDCASFKTRAAIDNAKNRVILLENLRFHPGEEANEEAFAARLASLATHYINDAFSTAHRAHASTDKLARFLPAAAGQALIRELDTLDSALRDPHHPVIAIVGGAKVSSKIAVLENLTNKVDSLIIGGGMANTFIAARGLNVGNSLCERECLDIAQRIEAAAEAHNCQLSLPLDAVVAPGMTRGSEARTTAINAVSGTDMILDVGPATSRAYDLLLETARTVVWNGPVGAFEYPPFERGTKQLALTIARLTDKGRLFSVAGGGDTVAALAVAGVKESFSHVSTAGGAFLEWIEGKALPGVEALKRADQGSL